MNRQRGWTNQKWSCPKWPNFIWWYLWYSWGLH